MRSFSLVVAAIGPTRTPGTMVQSTDAAAGPRTGATTNNAAIRLIPTRFALLRVVLPTLPQAPTLYGTAQSMVPLADEKTHRCVLGLLGPSHLVKTFSLRCSIRGGCHCYT